MVFGFGKKKKENIEEIKEAVSEVPITEKPITMPPIEPTRALPPEVERMAEEMELAPPPAKPKFAPLFVKIDRYREVLENIEKLKTALLNIDAVVSMRNEINRVKADADVLLEKTLHQFKAVIAELDREFVSPQEARPFVKPPESGLKTYVSDLEDEVRKLKEHVDRFK